jgi:hypothetical protein
MNSIDLKEGDTPKTAGWNGDILRLQKRTLILQASLGFATPKDREWLVCDGRYVDFKKRKDRPVPKGFTDKDWYDWLVMESWFGKRGHSGPSIHVMHLGVMEENGRLPSFKKGFVPPPNTPWPLAAMDWNDKPWVDKTKK